MKIENIETAVSLAGKREKLMRFKETLGNFFPTATVVVYRDRNMNAGEILDDDMFKGSLASLLERQIAEIEECIEKL